MEYRQIGDSGLRVSAVGLGSWLTYGRSVEEDTAMACLQRAWEAGVNFFDTANVYARGGAEEVLGRWLRRVPRSDVVVATKVYFPMGEGPNDRGLSRKHVMEQCHASLRRLGVEHIDLYQCHRWDDVVPLDETLRALDDLVAQGKVLYTGVSEWSAAQITSALRAQERAGMHRLVSNQPQYSLLARRIEEDVLPTCRREGVGQLAFSPLAGGALTGKYEPGRPPPEGSRGADEQDRRFLASALRDEVLEAVQRLRTEVAEPMGVTTAQLALAWVLDREGVDAAIVGASRPEQVEENVAAADVDLGREAREKIEEIMGPHRTVKQP